MRTWTVSGYTVQDGGSWTDFMPTGTVSIDAYDRDGDLVGEGEYGIAGEQGSPPEPCLSNYLQWTTYVYDNAGELTKTQVATQLATENNAPVASAFLETDYGYNSVGRQNAVTDPSGTITWTVFDAAGDVLSTWVGTDAAGATDSDPSSLDSGVRNPLNNMVEPAPASTIRTVTCSNRPRTSMRIPTITG